jgi:hypothetical protein
MASDHRKKFLRDVAGPFSCFFCEGTITVLSGAEEGSLSIHHLDHNHRNNALSNLAPTHYGCHANYHQEALGQKAVSG